MTGTGMVSQRSTERSSPVLLASYLLIRGDLKIGTGLNLIAKPTRNAAQAQG